MCNAATIKLTGADAPADNDKTDGYTAAMSLGFLGPDALNTTGVGLLYATCVIPVALTGADDTVYSKAPRGMCLGKGTATGSTLASSATWAAAIVNHSGILAGNFSHVSYAALMTNSVSKTATAWVPIVQAICTDNATAVGTMALLTPTGWTTMKDIITYGPITIPPPTTWYTEGSHFTMSAVPIASTTAAITATWMMPSEAETYADVPRLSPADASGW